jgi:hypothetical protein
MAMDLMMTDSDLGMPPGEGGPSPAAAGWADKTQNRDDAAASSALGWEDSPAGEAAGGVPPEADPQANADTSSGAAAGATAAQAKAPAKRWNDGADPADPTCTDGIARRLQLARTKLVRMEGLVAEQKAVVDRCSTDWRERQALLTRQANERLGAFVATLKAEDMARFLALVGDGHTPDQAMQKLKGAAP